MSSRPISAANKTAQLQGSVKDLLTSTNNEADDAVTTRQRLRQKRRDEVTKLYYEKAVPVKEARDPSHQVLSNCFHQEVTDGQFAGQAGRPLLNSVLENEYYQDLSRTVPICPPQEMRPGSRGPHGFHVGPFPQDDAHDYWGKPLRVGLRSRAVAVSPRAFVRNVGVQVLRGETPTQPQTPVVAPTPPDPEVTAPAVVEEEDDGMFKFHKPLVEKLPPKPTVEKTKRVCHTTTSTEMKKGDFPNQGGSRPPSGIGQRGTVHVPALATLDKLQSPKQSPSTLRYQSRPQDTPLLMF